MAGAVRLASGIASNFLNNQQPTVQRIGGASAKSGRAAALISQANKSSVLPAGARPDYKTGFANSMRPVQEMQTNIKNRQLEAAQKKQQEELQAQLAAAEQARLDEQTAYQESLLKMQQEQDARNKEFDKQLAAYEYPTGGSSSGGKNNTQTNSSGNSARDTVVQSALSLVGTPYAWGGGGYGNSGSKGQGMGTTNVIGVDCSGLTSYAYGTIGVKIPRQSQTQLNSGGGVKTAIKNAKPGDIIGWTTSGGGTYRHVAIYIGNGKVVHAPSPGKKVQVVSLSSLNGLGSPFAVSFLGA